MLSLLLLIGRSNCQTCSGLSLVPSLSSMSPCLMASWCSKFSRVREMKYHATASTALLNHRTFALGGMSESFHSSYPSCHPPTLNAPVMPAIVERCVQRTDESKWLSPTNRSFRSAVTEPIHVTTVPKPPLLVPLTNLHRRRAPREAEQRSFLSSGKPRNTN